MEQILIELKSSKAFLLLKQLEELDVLKVISPIDNGEKAKKREWSGSLSKDTAHKMLKELTESRAEWEKNSY
jgi:hypothetical protein